MGKYTDFLSQTPQERTKSAVTALSEMTSIPVTFPWQSPPPLLELWIASNSLWITYHSNCSINACLYGCHMCKKVRVSSTGTQTCAVCITTLTLTYKKRSEQRQKSFISLRCLRKDPPLFRAVFWHCPVAPSCLLLLLGNQEILAFSQKSYAGQPGFPRFRAPGSLEFLFSQSTTLTLLVWVFGFDLVWVRIFFSPHLW